MSKCTTVLTFSNQGLGLNRDSSPHQRRFDVWATFTEFGGEIEKLLIGVELWIEASVRDGRLILLSRDTRVLMTRGIWYMNLKTENMYGNTYG